MTVRVLGFVHPSTQVSLVAVYAEEGPGRVETLVQAVHEAGGNRRNQVDDPGVAPRFVPASGDFRPEVGFARLVVADAEDTFALSGRPVVTRDE